MSHFKSDLLPFPSHLCSAQLTDSPRNSVSLILKQEQVLQAMPFLYSSRQAAQRLWGLILITWHLNPIKTYHKG